MIIVPPGVGFSEAGVCGTHGYPGDYDFPADYDVAWGGFVPNDGNLDTITVSLSHELVEACTDPEDDGWTIKGGHRRAPRFATFAKRQPAGSTECWCKAIGQCSTMPALSHWRRRRTGGKSPA